MIKDYYDTLIKDIIENNDKEKAIKIIANKLNEKQTSNEKEILTNLEKDKEIERLHTIIKEVREYINHYETIRGYYEYQELGYDEYNYEDDLKKELLEILGSDKA